MGPYEAVLAKGELAGGDRLSLIRLRYGGAASIWGFGLYLASSGNTKTSELAIGFSSSGDPSRGTGGGRDWAAT